MVDLMHCLTNLLLFNIPLSYCYTNYNSSILYCLSSGDIIFSVVTLSASTSVLLFCHSLADFLETLSILSVTLLPVISPATSAVF